ncbi:hypothetical protein D3C78_1768500 [compost metagenome]
MVGPEGAGAFGVGVATGALVGSGAGAGAAPVVLSLASKTMTVAPALSKVKRTCLPTVPAGSALVSTCQVVFFWPVRATFQVWPSVEVSTV